MQCRKIQELLKADYLDNEISPDVQHDIDEHLKQCAQCRKLEKELQAQRLLFKNAKQEKVPERLWQNIRDSIMSEQPNQERSLSHGFLRRLRELALAPRPAYALVSAFTAVIFVLVFAGAVIQKRQNFSKQSGAEAITEYSVNGESDNLLYGLGTNIEEYFL